MARVDYDEIWGKQPDGSMKLLSRTPRAVSNEEEEQLNAVDTLRALSRKTTLTNEEIARAIRLLTWEVYGEDIEDGR